MKELNGSSSQTYTAFNIGGTYYKVASFRQGREGAIYSKHQMCQASWPSRGVRK